MENNTNVNENANNNASPKAKKPIFKKWWFWVIIVAVVIVIGAAASGGDKKEEKAKSDSTGSVVTEEAKDENKTEYAVGETIDYDGVKITMKKVKTSKGDKSSFIEADKGKEFVIANVSIKNDSDKKVNVNWASFEAYYDDNAVEADPLGQSLPQVKKAGELFGDVAPGKKIKGCVVYQVPKSWKKMEIIPKVDYDFGNDQNCKYIIKNK